jgi:hypothetical protein
VTLKVFKIMKSLIELLDALLVKLPERDVLAIMIEIADFQ